MGKLAWRTGTKRSVARLETNRQKYRDAHGYNRWEVAMSQDPDWTDAERTLIEAYQSRSEAPEELFVNVYNELRQVAHAYMRRERADHTLQGTALVNEAYLRLFEGEPFHWENRKHLFCTVARSMRRVLVDHARSHRAERHGGAHRKVTLDDQGPIIYRDLPQLLALDQALERLAKLNPRQAQVVELHSFAGLTEEETAEVLDVAVRTVKNDWRFAKAWLKTEMGGRDDSGAVRENP
jgi:RNA polymerase sigma-70 factor, ECF subfamily